MTQEGNETLEDHIRESNDWIAAEARQLFRALQAEDAKAVEVCLCYFLHRLVLNLGQHLRRDDRWDSKGRWLDSIWGAPPDMKPPTWLRIQNTLTWATRPEQDKWYDEPFEFELELWPTTGALRTYVFRFGDYRPLAEKALTAPVSNREWRPRVESEWAFVFYYPEKTLKHDE